MKKNTFKKIFIDKKNCGFWKQFSNIQFAHIIFENKNMIFVMATIEFQLIMMHQIGIREGANDKSARGSPTPLIYLVVSKYSSFVTKMKNKRILTFPIFYINSNPKRFCFIPLVIKIIEPTIFGRQLRILFWMFEHRARIGGNIWANPPTAIRSNK